MHTTIPCVVLLFFPLLLRPPLPIFSSRRKEESLSPLYRPQLETFISKTSMFTTNVLVIQRKKQKEETTFGKDRGCLLVCDKETLLLSFPS
jgi:hypothetical protein